LEAEIRTRYTQIFEDIASTARSAGRDEAGIRLVVVTKGHPAKTIDILYELGVRDIGENRVGEALFRQNLIGDKEGLNWHMIGHVQSRKADDVVGHFSLVHSVDRVKLAKRMNRTAQAYGIVQPVLLQFNVSGEETKSGWSAGTPEQWEALLPDMEAVLACDGLKVGGLMTMAPYSEDPEDARPSFVRLRKLRDYLVGQFPDQDWAELSMGMSGDYRVAVQEGATILRVGTAILGSLY
jgi:pyridoxal phosphate enzyme (YggS family)